MHTWGIPLTLAYLALLTWLVARLPFFRQAGPGRKLLLLFFGYRVFMGLALTLVYTYYYADTKYADIYKYYNDSYHMTRALWEHPSDFFKMLFGIGNDTPYFTENYYAKMDHWFRLYETQQYNDNHTMIRFNALVRVFSGGYFYVHTLFMCFLSFWGMTAFYRGFALFLPAHKHRILAFALFLFPSLTFWSAGVLKEGLLVFALGNVFYAAALFCRQQHRWRIYLLALCSLWLSLYLKSYALAALAAGLAGLVAAALLHYRRVWLVYAGVVALLVLLVCCIELFLPGYDVPAIIARKQWDFVRLSEAMQAGSAYRPAALEPGWGSILRAAPGAVLTGVFRPLPHEALKNPLMLLSGAESLMLIAGIVLCLVFFERPGGPTAAMLFCALFVTVITAGIIGLSTANFGSLVRYKVPLLPFVIYMLVGLCDTRRLPFLQTNRKTPGE